MIAQSKETEYICHSHHIFMETSPDLIWNPIWNPIFSRCASLTNDRHLQLTFYAQHMFFFWRISNKISKFAQKKSDVNVSH